MKESKIIFMFIREHFRKSTQTNFGKNQIQTILDTLESQYEMEKIIKEHYENES